MEILEFLKQENISDKIISEIVAFRSFYKLEDGDEKRIPTDSYLYYGKEIWEEAATAIIAGENILLDGPKATGKNVLAQNLAMAFARPQWDISLYINTDASSLIGSDTFENGEVNFRRGPILNCAIKGGFGVLDEINMAKNESLAVLHAVLDFRRSIDLPGYDRINLHEATRFIATMNYGYAGTREMNEALASRFMVLHMPVISNENLQKLMKDKYPTLKPEYLSQFASVFDEIRKKADGGEISTRSLDLRGLISCIGMMKMGLGVTKALEMGLINKCFDQYERQLVLDIISARFPKSLHGESIFS